MSFLFYLLSNIMFGFSVFHIGQISNGSILCYYVSMFIELLIKACLKFI